MSVATPTPKLGPEHIEALVEAIGLQQSMAKYDRVAGLPTRAALFEQRATRLAEIRAYLESLS